MIDFACKRFEIKEVVRCGLSLTKAEYDILHFFISSSSWLDTEEIAKKTELDQSTVQRAVKKLHEKGVIQRRQNNLSGGGYVYEYRAEPKEKIRKTIMTTVNNWALTVYTALKKW
ncbi:MAG: MarR family transcriptional regulator [Nanoarchaeota archaeon]